MSNHPLSPAGYDQEEAWAHQQNEEAKRKIPEKDEKEKAEKEKGVAATGSDSKTHTDR